MNIALVHDQLNEFGGAERVLLALSEMYPDAPIYTAYVVKGSPAWERFKDKDVRVSWMQYLWKLASPLRFLAPLIWNTFDFTKYDLIIGSSSWYITKGFIKKSPSTKEICYCHTPPRWLYGYPTSVNWQKYPLVRVYATIVGFFMRQYDFIASQRVDYFIANSKETQRRIEKFYRRESTVIYPPATLRVARRAGPPINVQNVRGSRDFYLFVSRNVGSKGLEIAIGAAKKLGFPLKIVGRIGENVGTIEYLGIVSDEELANLYAGAKAFLALATIEDFGMTPVEAMSYGTPVIAFNGGGYTESVLDGKTGILFDDSTTDGLVSAVQKFEKIKRNWSSDCSSQAKKFSTERFIREMNELIAKTVSKGVNN